MNLSQYSRLFSFLFNITNDVLVQAFEKGPIELRSLKTIAAEICEFETQTNGLLNYILED